MANKPTYTIEDQILLLKQRGMLFEDELKAVAYLKNISYYRLKGYWWDTQQDHSLHTFKPSTFFEQIIERYHFDRQLRIVLFDAVELVEVSLRTKMIYHMSLGHGGTWYTKGHLMNSKSVHENILAELRKDFLRSQEIFIKDQRRRFPTEDADAWKILEIASMGTLSKLYKNLSHQLPEKSAIAKEMGLNLHTELSSWLEAITYIRNIIAHHSRLWSRNMVKRPVERLNNPRGAWLSFPLSDVQSKKPFLIISAMIYLCDEVEPNHKIRENILQLFDNYKNIPVYKLGFLNQWKSQPVWNK